VIPGSQRLLGIASIPRLAWTIIGGPFEGLYRDASVIHDVACVEKSRPWLQVHRTFYLAMLASGVTTVKAKVMYAAVYHFGPRWSTVAPQLGEPGTVVMELPPPQTLREEDFEELRNLIESRDRSDRRFGSLGKVFGGALGLEMSLPEIENFRSRGVD